MICSIGTITVIGKITSISAQHHLFCFVHEHDEQIHITQTTSRWERRKGDMIDYLCVESTG